VHQVTADRARAEGLRQLGEIQQPVRIPRRPVGILAVGDPEDDVVRLRSLVEKLCDATSRVGAHRSGA